MRAEREIAYGFRAAVLHLPGVFRCDVRPSADAIEIMLRPLHDGPWVVHEARRGAWLVHTEADGAAVELEIAVDVELSDARGRARVTARCEVRRR